MEGPKIPSEARRRGAVAPPQYGGLGAKPPGKFSKNDVEIAYFGAILQAEMVSSALSATAGLDNRHS